jgi:hypothetical protein
MDDNREEKVDKEHDGQKEDGKAKPGTAQVPRPAEWTHKHVYKDRSCIKIRRFLNRNFVLEMAKALLETAKPSVKYMEELRELYLNLSFEAPK